MSLEGGSPPIISPVASQEVMVTTPTSEENKPQGWITRFKNAFTPQDAEPTHWLRDQILADFAVDSGLTPEECRTALGPFYNQLDAAPETIAAKNLPGEPAVANDLYQDYLRILKFNPSAAPKFLWRQVLMYKYETNAQFKTWIDTKTNGSFKDILTLDALSIAQDRLKQYESTKPATIKDVDHKTQEGILRAQAGLQEALEIGRRIRSEGYIPIYRYLFFSSDATSDSGVKKQALLQRYQQGDETFKPKNEDFEISTETVRDLSKHTDAKPLTGSPFDSWTYEPPNSSATYMASHFGRTPALMLVSKVKPEELIVMRRYGGSRAHNYKEEDTFYDPTEDKKPLAETTTVAELTAKGKRGAIAANEYEITLWGPQPNEGIIDLGP